MPSHERTRRFERDWARLTNAQRERFRAVFVKFDHDLAKGRFRSALRVKRLAGTDRIHQMTWAPDGRATFELQQTTRRGAHVIWRRIGTRRP